MITLTKDTLLKRESPLASAGEQRRILQRLESVPDFEESLASHGAGPLQAGEI